MVELKQHDWSNKPLEQKILSLVSVLLLVALVLYIRAEYNLLKSKEAIKDLRKLLQESQKKPQSYEVKELLQDLLAGEALVEIKRISPVDVLIRSPRGER